MSLTKEEDAALCALLKKMTWPISPEDFDAWCLSFVTNPIELAVVMRVPDFWGGSEILLFERDDAFYRGWYVCGTIFRPGDTEDAAFKRLVSDEIQAEISQPRFIERLHFPHGRGEGEDARGQKLSLLFVAYIIDGLEYRGPGRFWPLNDLPEPVLPTHKVIIERVRRYLALYPK